MSRQQEVKDRGRRTAGEDARARLLAGLPVTERREQLAGVSTAVLEGGDGPPIVFLQGEFAAVWMRVIPELVTTHRVIAPDLPGLGASEVSDGPPDADAVLKWLDELIEQTCAIPPVLVGKGPGGALAARFAIEHSDRIDRVVLVDTHGLARFRPPPGMALSFLGDLDRIAVPTTLIWGRHDLGVRLGVAEAASAGYGWPLPVIENARDDPAIEQPEAFLEALRTALDVTQPDQAVRR
jgi:pimeloyl-ACP methyl ester carboxylesterase